LITGKGLGGISEVGLVGEKARADCLNPLTMGLGEGRPRAHLPDSVEDCIHGVPHPHNWYMVCRIHFADSEMEIALTLPVYLYLFHVSEKAKRARRSKELVEEHYKNAYIPAVLNERKSLSQLVAVPVGGKSISVPEHLLLGEPEFRPLKQIQAQIEEAREKTASRKRKLAWNQDHPDSALAKKFKDRPEYYRQAVELYQATGPAYFETWSDDEEKDEREATAMN